MAKPAIWLIKRKNSMQTILNFKEKKNSKLPVLSENTYTFLKIKEVHLKKLEFWLQIYVSRWSNEFQKWYIYIILKIQDNSELKTISLLNSGENWNCIKEEDILKQISYPQKMTSALPKAHPNVQEESFLQEIHEMVRVKKQC